MLSDSRNYDKDGKHLTIATIQFKVAVPISADSI